MGDEHPEIPVHRVTNIATISAGFEKGDFLVREEQGNRVYFDFFEEAFNYIANKGYARMDKDDEKAWMDLMAIVHDSVKGGMKYNTGTLLMVLSRPVGLDLDYKGNGISGSSSVKPGKVRSSGLPIKAEPNP